GNKLSQFPEGFRVGELAHENLVQQKARLPNMRKSPDHRKEIVSLHTMVLLEFWTEGQRFEWQKQLLVDGRIFLFLNEVLQHPANGSLIPLALAPEEAQHLRRKAQGDLLFCAGPCDRLSEEVRFEWRIVGVIDLIIPQGVNPVPIRLGALFHNHFFLLGWLFVAK